MPAKRILILLRHEDEDRLIEALDIALVAGVFEQSVTVLFRDRALVTLCGPRPSQQIVDVTETLKDYGISSIFACSRTLAEQDLTLSKDGIVPLSPVEQGKLIGEQDMVIND